MELSTYFDKITGLMGRVKGREANRASEAGEDREEIGSMLELTGLNRRAFSFVRSLDKMQPEKRDDVLRSFDSLRDMLDPHWDGQSTPDMLDGKAPVEEAPAEEEVKADAPEETPEPEATPDPETEEFNAAVDETMDERVVPINFGGGKA